MSRLTTLTVGAATLLCGFAAAPEAAFAGPVGQLVCNVSGGTGLLITSSKALNCRYLPANGAPSQHYLGTIRKFGLDLGNSGPGTLTWGVVALGGAVGPGSLSGSYTGASASASVGVGAGANALVGGNNGGFTLQPVSVETTTGVNVAAGVSELTLDYAP